MKKKLVALMLAGAMVLGSSMQAFACMGVYVGKEVSENGSSYIGRSEDIGAGHTKIFTVHPAEDHEPGKIFKDAYGFSMPYPEHTYQYTLAKDSSKFGEGEEPFAEVGINENDVTMTATVSTAYNSAAKAADPLVDTGICEISMGSILLGQAESARHGVELLGEIIDQYGAGECNSIMLSDPNEAWFMEIVSGHQYAAIKLPDDKVSAIPNMMLLGTIDVTDTENVIVSEGLVSLAEENGFLKTEDGMIHVAQTYGKENPGKGQLSRLWQGTYYLNQEKGESLNLEPSEDGIYGPYDLLFTPDRKLSTQEIMKFLAYRGEGTVMDSNVNSAIYAIGNKNQAECHVLEMREGMYEGMAGIEWLAMSRAEFSLYLPYYGAMINETWEGYHNDELSFVPNSMFWVFDKLNDLADDNRELYGTNIRKYWDQYQAELIEQQKQVDTDMKKLYEKSPELAQTKATELGKAIAQDAYKSAESILNELEAFVATKSDGMFVPSVLTNNVMPNYSVSRVMDTVSTEKLEALIEQAKAVEKGNYTEDTYAVLEENLKNAEAVLEDTFAVQSEVDAAAEGLGKALAELKAIDKSTSTPTPTPKPEPQKQPVKAPKTGDANSVMWMLLAAVGSIGVSAGVWKREEEK